MNRVKEIQDREKAPKLNVQASKRMIKSALWQAAQKSLQENGNGTLHLHLLKFSVYLQIWVIVF